MFWLTTGVVFILFLLVFSSILLPFVAGMVLAYFLDPVADKLESFGMSRLAATITILIAFVVSFVLALMIIVPILATQLAGFAGANPSDQPGHRACRPTWRSSSRS